MRSTLLLAPLVMAAATLAAPYTPIPGSDPNASRYQAWSFRDLAYGNGIASQATKAEAAAQAQELFTADCEARNPRASSYFNPLRNRGRAEVACLVVDEQGRVLEDNTFRVAYNLDWSPLLNNKVAALPENHIYDYSSSNYGADQVGRTFSEKCQNRKGTPEVNTTEEMRAKKQVTLYCRGRIVDFTPRIAKEMAWPRVDLSETPVKN